MADGWRPGTKVQTVRVDSLVLDPRNARTHDERNLQAIRDSLLEHGQVEPLVVRRADRRVIGGNGRVEAMVSLGWERAKVVMLDISEEEAGALALRLNRSAELAGWDDGLLAELLQEVDDNFGDLGWNADELDEILSSVHVGEHDRGKPEQPVPDVPADPVSGQGEVYELGPHRLVCGDSTDRAVWDLLLGEERLRAVWTDPPYGIVRS